MRTEELVFVRLETDEEMYEGSRYYRVYGIVHEIEFEPPAKASDFAFPVYRDIDDINHITKQRTS